MQRIGSTPKTLYISIGLALGLGACSESPTLTQTRGAYPRDQLVASVTPSVAAHIGADGKFDLTSMAGLSQFPEITSQQAIQLAATWIKQFGPLHTRWLEKFHGAPIDFHKLVVCGRPLYARSAFQELPSDVPATFRRTYGPWYLVTACSADGSPTVSIAVSAWATELTVANGRIYFPSYSGNEFFSLGIPAGHVGEFPSSPEAAVAVAGQHGLVSAVPELVMPVNTSGPPQAASWHITLAAPALLHGLQSGAVSATELYVGLADVTKNGVAQFVAAKDQPSGTTFRWVGPIQPNETWTAYEARAKTLINTTAIARRPDTPLQFDAILSPEGR